MSQPVLRCTPKVVAQFQKMWLLNLLAIITGVVLVSTSSEVDDAAGKKAMDIIGTLLLVISGFVWFITMIMAINKS